MQKKILGSKHILLTEFNFSDLFSIDPWVDAREKFNGMHPFAFKLNFKTIGISGHDGFGIYFFMEKIKSSNYKLVYVGIRADANTIEKGFHEERVYKHIHTDTFRFPCSFVLSNSRNKMKLSNAIEQTLRNANIKNDYRLSKLIIKNEDWWVWRSDRLRSKDVKDEFKMNSWRKDIVTSHKRLNYVSKNWDYFMDDENITPKKFDSNYKFYFLRFDKPFFKNKKIKAELENIERKIVHKFHPITNRDTKISVEDAISYWKNKGNQDSPSIAEEIYKYVIEQN